MSEIKKGTFCSIVDVLDDKPGDTPFWELNGWVYRGGRCNDWLHVDARHKKIPWWNVKQYIKWQKHVYMGYTKCSNGICNYCEEKIPQEIVNKIAGIVE